MKQHYGSAADFAAIKGMRPFDEFEITSGSGAGNTYKYFGEYGWVQTHAGGAAHVEPRQLANEQSIGTSAQTGIAIPKCNASVVDVSVNSTSVSSGVAAHLLGVYVNTAIATEAVTIRNGAGGTALYTIPIGAAAGQKYEFNGAKFSNGIFVESTNATGSITVEWWPQV